MKIILHSSKSIKPAYVSGGSPAATSTDIIPLTVFDELNHNVYVPGIFFFHPPAPPITVLEHGLAKIFLWHLRRGTGHTAWRSVSRRTCGGASRWRVGWACTRSRRYTSL
ncbi:unnamed protein product [Urochloa humidicola]